MFILRQITNKGQEFNLSLGENYSVVDRKNEDDFKVISEKKGYSQPEFEKCYAFVLYSNGVEEQNWPLYKGFWYYIMTETGRTFANLTNRD